MPSRTGSLLATLVLCCDSLAQTALLAHHEHGQTWLAWTEPVTPPASYRIYASAVDFTIGGSTATGWEVGHILPADWDATRLKLALPGQEWVIPKPGPGTYALASDQALFVYTPHDTTPLHFAVVADGDTVVTADNGTGLIAQTLDPVTAHLQGLDTHVTGQTYRVFANWVDGNADHESGKPDYPVMGNASMNGCGSVFLVTDPTTGFPASQVAAVIALHGGEGHYMNFTPDPANNIGLTFDDAFLITPDGTINTISGDISSAWLGFFEGFDRFADPFAQPAPDGSVVVDYLHRRTMWQLDWVLAHFPIDPEALSALGHSAGSRGAGMFRRVHADRFAASHLYSALLEANSEATLMGSAAQNLTTTLPGSPGVADVADETTALSASERDFPFTRVVIGRNDTTGSAIWDLQQIEAYGAINDSRMGTHLFWDERAHGLSTWTGSWFNGSTHLQGATITRYRLHESFPALFDDDQDLLTRGRQPEMGSGDPLDGDTYGTWSGYYDWEQATLTDTPYEWGCTFYLTAQSATPQDNYGGASALASLSIRRPQQFLPPAGSGYFFALTRESDDAVLQAGVGAAEADGLVVVPDLETFPDPDRVRLTVHYNPQAEPYGTGCAGSGGFTPVLGLVGLPVLGSAVTLRLEQGLGGSSVLFLFGLTPAATPMSNGCTLNVAPLLPLILGPLPLTAGGPGEGRLEITALIPPGLATGTITMQGFTIDSGVAGGFANTNGLEVTITP